MPHYLVTHLQFTRAKWLEGLAGVTAEEAVKRFEPMNAIGWAIGHLAAFEQHSWLETAQGKDHSEAVKACGFGKPATTPPLAEMQAAWQAITAEADLYLNQLTATDLAAHLSVNGKPMRDNIGTLILRHTYHYWYHLGEVQAIRQLLGHQNLPPFVGQMPPEVGYKSDRAE